MRYALRLLCASCARGHDDRARFAAGVAVLLVNFDEDSGAGRHFTNVERKNVAEVRAWLKTQT